MKDIINEARLFASGQAARQAKADRVKQSAEKLLILWAKEVSSLKGCNFYMHTAFHHLPDFICRLPVDILQASGDSFEAKNQEMKRRLRRYVSCVVGTFHVFICLSETQTIEISNPRARL